MTFHSWCAADRDYLLERARDHYRRGWATPAQAVRWCCGWLGYSVRLADWLPLGQRGELDLETRTVWLNQAAYTADSKNTADRLAETLAHELGHIRLHRDQLLAGVRTEKQEEEAQAYARIFLLPQQWFRFEAPAVAEDHLAAYRAAKAWGVSPGFVVARAREVCVGSSALATVADEDVFRFR